jgi:hypothetical protein
MGLLAATNGVGDMLSSAAVGVLWSLFPAPVGFACAAGLQGLGALVIARTGVRRGASQRLATSSGEA